MSHGYAEVQALLQFTGIVTRVAEIRNLQNLLKASECES